MGSIYAAGLAETTNLRTAVSLNLSLNHYPPLPGDYVDPVIEAIDAVYDDEPYRDIVLPLNIEPRPRTAVPHPDGWAVPAAVLLDITHCWAFAEIDD